MHTITTSPDHTKACIPLLSLIDWDQSQHIHWIIFSDHLGQPSWAFVNLRFGIYSSLNDPNIQCILILNVRWLLANSEGTLSGHRIPPGFPLPQNSPIFCDKTHWVLFSTRCPLSYFKDSSFSDTKSPTQNCNINFYDVFSAWHNWGSVLEAGLAKRGEAEKWESSLRTEAS